MDDEVARGDCGETACDSAPLPFLTAHLPPLPGRIKQEVDDFVVEEIPAYLPCGDGEHLFLWIEKRDVSVEFLKRHLARTLELSQREIGMAGIKDRRAVTRQWISVPRHVEPKVGRIETEAIRVLEMCTHRNKLKTSHLKGNRFSILLRLAPSAAAVETADEVTRILLEQGVPNYYGEQRFGRDSHTLHEGLHLLRGCGALPGRTPGWKKRLRLSAVQSWLYNQVLARRMAESRLHRVLPGDVLQVVASGGLFVSSDPSADQPRFDRREVVPTGPLFGPKMRRAEGEVGAAEIEVLYHAGLEPACFERHKKLVPGARRPLLIWPERLETRPAEEGLRFEMTLPAGTYATVVLREYTKGLDERDCQPREQKNGHLPPQS